MSKKTPLPDAEVLAPICCLSAVEYLESSMMMMCEDHKPQKHFVIVDDYWVLSARNDAMVRLDHCISMRKR